MRTVLCNTLYLVLCATIGHIYPMVPIYKKHDGPCIPCTPYTQREYLIAQSTTFYACLNTRRKSLREISHSVILQPHKHITTVSDLTRDQWKELGTFIQQIAGCYYKLYGVTLKSALCIPEQRGDHMQWFLYPNNISDEQDNTFTDPDTKQSYHLDQYHADDSEFIQAELILIKNMQKNIDISQLPDGRYK